MAAWYIILSQRLHTYDFGLKIVYSWYFYGSIVLIKARFRFAKNSKSNKHIEKAFLKLFNVKPFTFVVSFPMHNIRSSLKFH